MGWLGAAVSLRYVRLGSAIMVAVPVLAAAQPPDPARLRDAITRGVAAIQTAQRVSRTSQSCTTTCHLQLNGAFAYRAAREHGIALDEAVARADFERGFLREVTDFSLAVEIASLGEIGMNQAFTLVAAHELGLPRGVVPAAMARAVALKQASDGGWTALQQRPPSNHSRFTFTALGLRALQLYGHERERDVNARRIASARTWLRSHAAPDTEGRTFQLFGLAWAGAGRDELAPLVRALAGAQAADGGWNALAGRDSDVYSTAQALVVLHDVGAMPVTAPAWQRGLAFLLRAQAADGTWRVRTRLPPWVSPPYYESGYPYGRDQFISVAGANWAIRALTRALGPPSVPAALPLEAAVAAPREAWVETAMFGTAAELRALLDGGLSPDAATSPGQTSLLMLAAPDAEKVRLLLDRGAKVDAASRLRSSALLVAAQYRDAIESARVLLARGARIGPAAGQEKPVGDAFPVFVAAHGGNTELLAELRRAGDALDDSARMFGGAAPASPLAVATLYDHIDTARRLIELGARVDPADRRLDSPLVNTILANYTELAGLLIERGADVNRVDQEGRTPLMYAVVADFGDTTMVDLLLRSGARTDARDPKGRTAADYAREYGHDHLIGRLSPRSQP